MVDLYSELKGQHVLITGAAGGIGVELANLFLSLGCNLSLHYNSQKQTLDHLIEQYPDRVVATSVNASDEQAIIKGIASAVHRFGYISIAIINHAIYVTEPPAPIWDMPLDQWQKVLNINLTSYMLYAREWARQLKSHAAQLSQAEKTVCNASLIFIGSTAGKFGEADHSDYATCKGALQGGLLLSLKNELVRLVPAARCNTVAPGWTATPMADEAIEKGLHLKSLQTMPMKKVATPRDIALACLYYADREMSSHVTGAVHIVAGGMEGRVQNVESL